MDTSSAEWISDEEINYSNTRGFSIKTSRLNEDWTRWGCLSVCERMVCHTHVHTLSSSSIGLFVWERVASDVSTRVANVGTLIDLFRH